MKTALRRHHLLLAVPPREAVTAARPAGRALLPGRADRCLPRQAGRTITRQVARQPRPAKAPAAARYENTAINREDRARLPRPDGAGTWAENGRATSFLLEYDTGTEHLGVLVGKLDGYYVLAAGLAWHEQASPVLLFCFGSPRREQAARRTLAASRDAATLRIATTALDPRTTSPAGPVWLPLPATRAARCA